MVQEVVIGLVKQKKVKITDGKFLGWGGKIFWYLLVQNGNLFTKAIHYWVPSIATMNNYLWGKEFSEWNEKCFNHTIS